MIGSIWSLSPVADDALGGWKFLGTLPPPHGPVGAPSPTDEGFDLRAATDKPSGSIELALIGDELQAASTCIVGRWQSRATLKSSAQARLFLRECANASNLVVA